MCDRIGSWDPDEDGWAYKYMDWIIGISVALLVILFLFCYFQKRKQTKETNPDLIVEKMSDDDSFSDRNVMDSNDKISYQPLSPQLTQHKRSVRLNGSSSIANNLTN